MHDNYLKSKQPDFCIKNTEFNIGTVVAVSVVISLIDSVIINAAIRLLLSYWGSGVVDVLSMHTSVTVPCIPIRSDA